MATTASQVLIGFQYETILDAEFDRSPRMTQWIDVADLWCLICTVVCLFAPAIYHQIVEAGTAAAIRGNTRLFQHTALGPRGLAASSLVRFLGDAAALLLIWLAAARATTALPEDGGWRSLVRHTIPPPLATVIVLGLGYGVPLFLLGPFLNDAAMTAYG